jgi:cellulose synthase/poly-beta-1,6-N-acetylglucosamine synthase-like glycosyltransferase
MVDAVAPLQSGADSDALVTVVIPARNEERFIGACLDSVLAQTYPHLEILVVDGSSTDRTPDVVNEYAERYGSIRLLRNEKRITPSSLNVGAAHASGKWFVRVDAHATVSPNYVEGAIDHLRTGRWGAVGGFVDPIGVTPAGRAIACAMCSRFGIGNSAHHFAGEPKPADHVPFPAYPIALLRELGGWNEELVTNQDFEFDYRAGLAGYELLYDPALRISYHCQQSTRGVFRQFRRYGRGKADVLALHPRSVRMRHLAAPALVASLATAAVLVPLSRRPLAVVASAYLAGLGIASALDGRGLDPPAQRRLPVVFAAMHIGWGVGFAERVGALSSPRLRNASRGGPR